MSRQYQKNNSEYSEEKKNKSRLLIFISAFSRQIEWFWYSNKVPAG